MQSVSLSLRLTLLSLPLLASPLLAAAVTLGGRLQPSSVSSFVAEDGSFCAEADSRTAQSALALKKAGPLGRLFSTVVAALEPCSVRGYSYAAGEDPLYAGLQTFFTSAAAQDAWPAVQENALARFANEYGIQQSTVLLMVNCTSHPQSQAAQAVTGQCHRLDGIPGAWTHRDPANGHRLICDGGPYTYATFVLASIKSSIQLPMHPADQCAPKSCADIGFPYLYAPPDHCYPKMHIGMRTPDINTDPGIQQSNVVEGSLGKIFPAWAEKHGADQSVLGTQLGCNCLASSEVGRTAPPECAARKPAVNDWWVGQLP